MTHALSSRVTSRKLTVCSILFISVNVLAAAHEVVGGVYGAVASTAGLAVGASCTSALVCILFLAWLARFTPSVSSWIAAFTWGSGGALIIAGIGNGVIDAAVEATSLGEDAADVVTSVVTGPLVEEAAKGIGVLIIILAVRRLLEHPAQGAGFGALVGAGCGSPSLLALSSEGTDTPFTREFLAGHLRGLRCAGETSSLAFSLESEGIWWPSWLTHRLMRWVSLPRMRTGTSSTAASNCLCSSSAWYFSSGECDADELLWRHERTRLASGRGRLPSPGSCPRPVIRR